MELYVHLSAILIFLSGSKGAILRADISMNGVAGIVEIISASSTTANIRVNVTGFPGNLSWEVRELPLTYTKADRCSDADVGTTMTANLTGLFGPITSGSFLTQTKSLSWSNVEGKSLVMYQTAPPTKRFCGTLEDISTKNTAEARFTDGIAGRVVFRQPSSASVPTTGYTNLYTATTSATAKGYAWAIYSRSTQDGVSGSLRCANVGSLVTNLSSMVTVGSSPGVGRATHHITSIALSGANSVVGKSLVLLDAGSIVTCANIRLYSPKDVRATINMGGISGYVRMQQRSPWDKTQIQVNIQGLQSRSSGYHVHNYTIPIGKAGGSSLCSSAHAGGHWNPYNWMISTSPSPGNGTNDEYEVGDLSGKFGTLDGKTQHSATYYDWNLPLFGTNSVVGRSIVVHYDATNGNGRWACATIEYPADVITAEAHFRYPVIGKMVFRQASAEPWSDTSISVHLAYSDNTAPSAQHNFHVHIDPNGADWLGSSTRCSDNKGHYNPFTVNVGGSYGTECSGLAPERCEVGDTSRKVGQVNIGDAANFWYKTFFTDETTPLSGPLSVIGRSIVIHAANSGAPRLACADIVNLPEVRATTVGSWAGSSVGGDVTFSQTSSLDITTTSVSLSSLTGTQAQAYHVHLYPLPESETTNTACSAANVAGHFNPFNASNFPPAATGTNDQYEVGDLSNKYGLITQNVGSFSGMYEDNNLPLSGPYSIVGRSIVIHQASGARYTCADIDWDLTPMSASKIEAVATFSGTYEGTVRLTQLKLPTGTGNTIIEMDVKFSANNSQSSGHNWHVHTDPISGGSCSSALGHYNPFNVSVASTYSTACTSERPERCELGDLSNKHRQYTIGGGKALFTDSFLPLHGDYSVLGRSIVIHQGAARIACADIVDVKGFANLGVQERSTTSPPTQGVSGVVSSTFLIACAALLSSILNGN